MPASGEIKDRVFRFGVFEANEPLSELRKHGVRIKLYSQPFQVLIVLLENAPQLVTREALRERLWGANTFVDFDHSLNTAVNKIRDALDDSASQPRYIETLSGKGYRFIAPVTLTARDLDARVETAHELTETRVTSLLTAPDELPAVPGTLVRTLLMMAQAMYLAFYVGTLANFGEIHDIFVNEKLLAPVALMWVFVTSAALLIPVRLFVFAAVAFNFRQFPAKFRTLFPVLLAVDLLWALSPFLLIHHISIGLAIAMSAALVYMPFAQRSLVLMYARRP